MFAPLVSGLGAIVLWAACIGSAGAQPQGEPAWRIHSAIDGDRRPSLCVNRDNVNVLATVVARAAEARGANDGAKSARLLQIATQLEGEICFRPAAEDIVILRCKVAQRVVGGTNIAVVKLSALIRAEASKGEQPFFAWTNAGIDESGGDTADAQSATGKWCAEQVAEEPFSVTPDLILRAQQRLYDLGLRISQINGLLTGETVQSLIEFQKWANLPPTGQLTKQTLDKVNATPTPSAWVSYAFDGYGNYAAQTGVTRRGTEIDVIRQLQRRTRGDFKLSSAPGPNCIALAATRYTERGRRSRTTFTQAFTSAGDSVEAAGKNALEFCEREKGGGRCDVRHTLCAGGGAQAERYDRNNPPVGAPPRFDSQNLPNNTPRFDPKNPSINSVR